MSNGEYPTGRFHCHGASKRVSGRLLQQISWHLSRNRYIVTDQGADPTDNSPDTLDLKLPHKPCVETDSRNVNGDPTRQLERGLNEG